MPIPQQQQPMLPNSLGGPRQPVVQNAAGPGQGSILRNSISAEKVSDKLFVLV
jgi:hypothetical protein